MSYANNEGVRIHYEVVGDAPPLVPMRGIAHRIEVWNAFGMWTG